MMKSVSIPRPSMEMMPMMNDWPSMFALMMMMWEVMVLE